MTVILVTIQGYGGGISIAEGYKVDKSIFTEEELQMLLTGLGGLERKSLFYKRTGG